MEVSSRSEAEPGRDAAEGGAEARRGVGKIEGWAGWALLRPSLVADADPGSPLGCSPMNATQWTKREERYVW